MQDMRYRTRHLETQVKRLAQKYKVVLILGARQVGKSTLLKHLFPTTKCFVFDPLEDLYHARKDPDLFLQSYTPPLILDEVQYVPQLLSALKRKVDLSSQNGLYFLTGSQNLNVLKNVAESMAGRVGILHLDPMTPYEMVDLGEERGWLPFYLDSPASLMEEASLLEALPPFTQVLWRGSLPASLELEEADIPILYKSYFLTYIDRDVRTLENIQDLGDFDRFMGLISMLTANEINFSQLGREIGISPLIAKKWLHLLSYTYQWFEIPPYHQNTIKRLSNKKKGYFKDTGFVCYRQRISSPDALAITPQLGSIFETWVASNIHQQFVHLSVPPNIYHWRTSGGAEVDLILERDGKLYPIEVKCKSHPTLSDTSGIRAFRKTYPHHCIEIGLVIHAGTQTYWLDSHTLAIPWNYRKKQESLS